MGGGAFSQWGTQAVWRVICKLGSTGTVQGDLAAWALHSGVLVRLREGLMDPGTFVLHTELLSAFQNGTF